MLEADDEADAALELADKASELEADAREAERELRAELAELPVAVARDDEMEAALVYLLARKSPKYFVSRERSLRCPKVVLR